VHLHKYCNIDICQTAICTGIALTIETALVQSMVQLASYTGEKKYSFKNTAKI